MSVLRCIIGRHDWGPWCFSYNDGVNWRMVRYCDSCGLKGVRPCEPKETTTVSDEPKEKP